MKKDIYKRIAKDVINAEIISLNKLKNSLDLNFKKAVERILNCKKGKVILFALSGRLPKNFFVI